MTTDRARLEKAIVSAEECMAARVIGRREEMQILIDASRAHLDTLPRTKMVEVWRAEYASNGLPCVVQFETRGGADDWVQSVKGVAFVSCIKVTGPHQQEVPAT
jgi:hypothetical protein